MTNQNLTHSPSLNPIATSNEEIWAWLRQQAEQMRQLQNLSMQNTHPHYLQGFEAAMKEAVPMVKCRLPECGRFEAKAVALEHEGLCNEHWSNFQSWVNRG